GAVQEVWVAAGTYYPDRGTGDRLAGFRLANGVSLYGGFAGSETILSQRDWVANPTILSGDIGVPGEASDNSYHVILASDRDDTASIDGFIISDGWADGSTWPFYVGAGMLSQCSSATVENCVLSDHYAAFVGGAIYSEESPQNFGNCTVRFSTAVYGGGVEHFLSDPYYYFCTFHDDGAEIAGGGVHCNLSAPTFELTDFLGNYTTGEGGFYGGLRAFSGSSPELLNTYFEGNSAVYGGGLGADTGSSMHVSDSIFYANIAGFSSGAAEIYDNYGEFLRCTFEANEAGSQEEGFGHAGGLSVNNSSAAYLEDCDFISNQAGEIAAGLASFDSHVRALRCSFIENHAGFAGALWTVNGLATMTSAYSQCRFHGNTAEFGAGAIHASGGGSHRFVNSILTGNTTNSGWGGGFFGATLADVLLDHCTIYGNSAPVGEGGGIHSDGSTTTLTHSIVWNNVAFGGTNETAQIASFNDPTYVLSFNDVQSWSGALGGTDNFAANPLLVDPDGGDNLIGTVDDDIHLTFSSPCLERGDPAYSPPPDAELEIDGLPRVMGCRVDLGADEYAIFAHAGDMNGDGAVNLTDVPIFVTVILNGTGSLVQICEADVFIDGQLNGRDVPAFVTELLTP
ncbi:MAG TPA: dockerin type I domain-containing protein, partial [Phycisphaerae bacterium]|nr:dockerin type I domain-containing protein [Phycisphaerae bacterium]